MSVSIWAYLPERCDGDVCVGDCDLCSKAQDNVAMMEGDSNVPDTNVGDMINRQDAIDAVADYIRRVCRTFLGYMTEAESKKCATCVLRPVPSATQSNTPNTLEVLKCVECMHWREYTGIRKEKTHICEIFDWFSKEEDFCSCAERKDGDNDAPN